MIGGLWLDGSAEPKLYSRVNSIGQQLQSGRYGWMVAPTAVKQTVDDYQNAGALLQAQQHFRVRRHHVVPRGRLAVVVGYINRHTVIGLEWSSLAYDANECKRVVN